MPVNPFRPLPSVPRATPGPAANAVPASDTQKLTRGMDGGERAVSIKAIASDIQMRTARIQHLRAMSQKMHDEIKNMPQKGSSRIAQLARRLDNDF